MSNLHLVIMAVVGVFSSANADLIFVDDDNCPGPGSGMEGDPYCSIQTAIDNALDTDEIVVAPGTYFETINFLGKAITLRSSYGAEVTVISANGPEGADSAVTCASGERADTILDGFTLTDGTGTHAETRCMQHTDCTATASLAPLRGFASSAWLQSASGRV